MYTRNFYNKNLKTVSRELRKNMTPAEDWLWRNFLRFFKPRVHRQRPLGNFIADFYIPKARLVIEIDGGIHDTDKAKAKDFDRTMIIEMSGIFVIRFSNEDVFQRFPSICQSIQQTVSSRLKI